MESNFGTIQIRDGLWLERVNPCATNNHENSILVWLLFSWKIFFPCIRNVIDQEVIESSAIMHVSTTILHLRWKLLRYKLLFVQPQAQAHAYVYKDLCKQVFSLTNFVHTHVHVYNNLCELAFSSIGFVPRQAIDNILKLKASNQQFNDK